MAEKDYQLLKDKTGYSDKDMQERCVCVWGGGFTQQHTCIHCIRVCTYVRMYSM